MAIRERILVIEDEILISMMLEQSIEALGRSFVGTESTVEGALERISREEVDGVVIDRWLRGQRKSDDVAKLLLERGIPFVVATGDAISLEDPFKEGIVLRKPFSIDQLEAALDEMDRLAMH